jgi:uncharacterized Zn-binding protein involved in type VI secretion
MGTKKPAAIPESATIHGGVLPRAGSSDVLINGVGAWRSGDIHNCAVRRLSRMEGLQP